MYVRTKTRAGSGYCPIGWYVNTHGDLSVCFWTACVYSEIALILNALPTTRGLPGAGCDVVSWRLCFPTLAGGEDVGEIYRDGQGE